MIVKLEASETQATLTAVGDNALRLIVAWGIVCRQYQDSRSSADLHPIRAKFNGNHSV